MQAPILTRDPAACAYAYEILLNWPTTPGHRYRPRSGCTCNNPHCPTPGAHPLPGAITPRPAQRLADELDTSPGASLIAPTRAFDAISLPYQAGMAAMVSLDRHAPVPCLTTGQRAILLVLPATGRYAVPDGAQPSVEVRSGPEQWVALPPSHGVRWDTPPWHEQLLKPVPLLHGGDLQRHLKDALRHTATAPGDAR